MDEHLELLLKSKANLKLNREFVISDRNNLTKMYFGWRNIGKIWYFGVVLFVYLFYLFLFCFVFVFVFFLPQEMLVTPCHILSLIRADF